MASRRITVLLAAVVLAAGLFFVLKGGDQNVDKPTATTRDGATTVADAPPLVIRIGADGKPQGGVQDLTVSKGDAIRFTVDSGIADEVHLHGYDISKDVAAGGAVTFDLQATIEGRFEAELEHAHEQILSLTVNP